jgi:hypothetical protein
MSTELEPNEFQLKACISKMERKMRPNHLTILQINWKKKHFTIVGGHLGAKVTLEMSSNSRLKAKASMHMPWI